MRNRSPDSTIADALMLPRLVRLQGSTYAAGFVLMKLLPAKFIMDRASDAKLICPGTTIIETTSGTFGLALAILCSLRGYRLVLVSDPAIDQNLQRRLEDLNTSVEIVREPAAVGGFQQARLDHLAELQSQIPDHFWPSQYDNPHNPGAYAPLAELLAEAFGEIDCLVGTVGSGGSMCGTSKYLRMLYPHMRVVGVDTHGSVLFGQPDGRRLLRGLGNSLMPKNLDHSVFDEIHWVSAAEAFHATRILYRRHALFQGATSGAAYLAARWWADRNPGARVVALLPDEGFRYQDSVYNDEWLRANDLWLSELPSEPRLVDHPACAGPEWSRIFWNRRAYEEITGTMFKPAEQLCLAHA